jgi:5-methylthioadenosine/S-adenosylhomocysteine deaminase
MQTVDLIIEADWVVSLDDTTAGSPRERGAIAVDTGRIVAVGAAAEILAAYDAREHCIRRGSVLMPGFVDAHADSSSAARGVRSPANRPAASDDVFALTRIAFADYLRAGVTCVAEWSSDPSATLRAASETRLRTVLQMPITDGPTSWSANARDALTRAQAIWDELKTHPLIGAAFAVTPSESLSTQTLADVRRIADQVDAAVSAAWLGSTADVQDSIARRGRRPLRWLADAGLLRHGFTAAQCGALEREELELLARCGGALVCMPQAALRQGLAGPDLRAIADAQVATALGSAAIGLLGAPDMLLEARLAYLLAEQSGATSSAYHALQRATLGGARARGLDDQTGSLIRGKAADCIALDLSSVPLEAYDDLYSALLFGVTRSEVTDVWVAGRHLVANRKLTELDPAELRADHAQILQRRQWESAA